jgi:two-component system sensor histidine kinase CiaH
MPDDGKKKFRRITIIYWVLLIYIIAALLWWFVSLYRQNKMMTDFERSRLESKVDKYRNPEIYAAELEIINNRHTRNNIKYISEGVAFFVIILVGAAFVYRSVRRQFYLQQQQQNFMMAVTHELKTPISVARLNLETIQKYSLDKEKLNKLIKMTLQETGRLDFLTNNILVSSQLEGEGYRLSGEELDLSDLLKDCLQDFRNRYPDRKFLEQIEPGMDVKGDALLLKILINNLLENAVKYAPKEKPVTARLGKMGSIIKLEIADEGPGIAGEEKEKIFGKFYRIGNEATRKTQGTGLGLYLCKKIAADHNADISVTDNTPCGSIFSIAFKA